jgi:hypothetical protein
MYLQYSGLLYPLKSQVESTQAIPVAAKFRGASYDMPIATRMKS